MVSVTTSPPTSSSSGGLDQGGINFEQVLGKTGERLHGQTAVSLVGRSLKRKGDACPNALGCRLFHSELGGNGVGRPKADAPDLASKAVRVFGHHMNGFMAVGLEDADRAGRPDPVRMQENH